MPNLTGRTLLNRYYLRELIGSGGMGDVYLAWDQKRSTRMAIKVLRRDLASYATKFRMFTKEAELLRTLEHPNIVRLYEFEKEDDLAFIVMDWVDGSNLRQDLADRKRPFSLEETSHILQPVCTALHYAHQNGIYHCDIKPANILKHSDGRVLLSDFGVARLASDSGGGGTPPYMAPEQFITGEVSAQTDIYSLGITLYEMFSGGEVPFRGKTSKSPGTTRDRIGWEHNNIEARPLNQVNPALPSSVITIVSTALQKKPEFRYQSPMELVEAFDRARLTAGGETASRQTKEDTKDIFSTMTSFISRIPVPSIESMSIKQPVEKPRQILPKGPHLVARQGDLVGEMVPLTAQEIVIGRAKDAQIRLSESSVSRKHATILRTKRGIYIRDENSSLGTYVNKNRVPPGGLVQLHNQDIIQIGYQQLFEFRER